MHKIRLSMVLVLVMNSGCSKRAPSPPQPEVPHDVIAMVGDEPITTAQFSVEAARRHIGDDAKSKKALLDEMIRTRLLGQEARQRGYEHDPQVVVAVDNFLADRLRQEIRSETKAGSQEIETYYKAHAAEFMTPTAVRAAVIFVATPPQMTAETRAEKRVAMDTIRQRAAGLPPSAVGFGPLAAQYSDDQETKLKGGDMGFFVEGHANPIWEKPVIDAALALTSPNQLSDVVSTDRGYYLVKLTAKHNASPRPMESVRLQIEKRLAEDNERHFVAGLIKAAEDKSAIKVFNDRLAVTPVQDTPSGSPTPRQPSTAPNQ